MDNEGFLLNPLTLMSQCCWSPEWNELCSHGGPGPAQQLCDFKQAACSLRPNFLSYAMRIILHRVNGDVKWEDICKASFRQYILWYQPPVSTFYGSSSFSLVNSQRISPALTSESSVLSVEEWSNQGFLLWIFPFFFFPSRNWGMGYLRGQCSYFWGGWSDIHSITSQTWHFLPHHPNDMNNTITY